MTEQRIQTLIKEKLTKAGWFVTKITVCSTPGFPDLLALRNGTALLIECKRPGGKATPLQLHIHEKLRAQGFEVILTDSVELIHHHIKNNHVKNCEKPIKERD
jgi:hypothetical protein